MTTNAPCDSLLISIPWLVSWIHQPPLPISWEDTSNERCVITPKQSGRMQDKNDNTGKLCTKSVFCKKKKKGVLFKPRCMRMNRFTWNLILINIPSPPCMQLTPGLEIGCNSVSLVNLIKAVQNRLSHKMSVLAYYKDYTITLSLKQEQGKETMYSTS